MGTQIAAVIFDFGGVIIPGSPSGDAANSPWAPIERQHGLVPGFLWKAFYIENPEWQRLRVGDSSEEAWHAAAFRAVAAASSPETAEAVVAAVEASRPQGKALEDREPEFNAGMLPLLATLRSRVKVGLLSNAAPGLEENLKAHYRIDHLFDDIINSATVRLAKPDARVFELAASRLGLSPDQCFFTDDLEGNVRGARAVGMMAHVFEGAPGLIEALRGAGVEI